MELKIKSSRLFADTHNASTRFVIHMGGTRSGKTYAIMQWLIVYCLEHTGKVVTVVRKTLPSAKATVVRDFMEIMQELDLWEDERMNKTELTYTLNDNLIEFISVDQPQKIRGRKRDILFCNEANELMEEDFRQLVIRTYKKIILDLNPSDAFSWVYELFETRYRECTVIHSTWRDNPFLSDAIIREIESYKDTDPDFYRVFGLGERSVSGEVIYQKWETYDVEPEGPVVYGLDVGWNHPMALVKVVHTDRGLYASEVVYEKHITTGDLITRMEGIKRGDRIYVDSARPDVIEELRRADFNAIAATKDVKAGIDFVKRHRIFVHAESLSLQRELKSYKWKKDVQGRPLDEPVKVLDDGLDALRYAAYSLRLPKSSGVVIDSIDW